MADKLLFETSTHVVRRLTDTFDFVWPTAAAMWNLRWQVSASEEDLAGRFIAGSQIHGANLRRACISTSWEEQLSQFARFLLIDLCALYEAWCDGVVAELQLPDIHRNNMQFPTNTAGVTLRGVGATLSEVQNSKSSALELTISVSLKSNRKYVGAHLENLLKCYRFFKECRNAIIHQGSRASDNTERAYLAFAPLTAADLTAKEVPKHFAVRTNGTVDLDLRGVVGFGDVILKLITTLDAELSLHRKAERVLANRWRSSIGTGRTLPAEKSAKATAISRYIGKLGLRRPKHAEELAPILKKYCLVLFA